jgi:hypothetical protein
MRPAGRLAALLGLGGLGLEVLDADGRRLRRASGGLGALRPAACRLRTSFQVREAAAGTPTVTFRLSAKERLAAQPAGFTLTLRAFARADDRAVRDLGFPGTHGAAVLLDAGCADSGPFAGGWHAPEGDGSATGWRWSRSDASLTLAPLFAAGDATILLDCTQVYGGTPDDLQMTVNGLVCRCAIAKAPRRAAYRWTLAVHVPADQMAETHSLSLAIHCPTGGVPAERESGNPDPRDLGLAVKRVRVLAFQREAAQPGDGA